jgi:hypothetical protein
VRHEKRAARQQTQPGQPYAAIAPLGIEQHRQAQPDEEDGVKQRNGGSRPHQKKIGSHWVG